MTRPNDPSSEEHTDASDGLVRSLLWRLRARLVTPPDADRAEFDLGRILAAAKDHAHEPPGGELAEFRDRVTPAAASADEPGADDTDRLDAPIPIRSLKLAPTGAANEANRGVRISQQVSRVAAVAVLVVGVGGGLAAAVDRDGAFLALFASGASNSEAPAEDTLAVTPSESLELDGDALDPEAEDDVEAPAPDDGADVDTAPPSDGGGSNDAEVADDTDDDATDTSDASTGSDGGAAESRDEPSSDRGNGNGSGSSTDPAPAPTPTPPADEPDDEPADDTVDDTVIALPENPVDPGDLDGFGGSRDCPDGDLSACLPGNGNGSGNDSDDASDDDAGSGDDDESDSDDGSDERKKKDPLEELAERRYGG